MDDVSYMEMARGLALRGGGWVNPNPQVGCVIVKDGRVIGQGWHERFGQKHAERNALASCTEDPRGATAYVTLEPCCHTGHQPPCTDALIAAGVARVVVGSSDPNPLVAGKGVGILRAAGIEVDEHVDEAACDRVNEIFFHYITSGLPFVTLKYAMTLDGKVATRTGASRWVSGEEARRRVHADRARYASVMVGAGTELADDPLLTARGVEGAHQPARVVADARLRTPLGSKLVSSAHESPVIIATCEDDESRRAAFEQAGCQVLVLPAAADGRGVDPLSLMRALGAAQIDSVLLEGGPTLAASMLAAGLVSRVQAYVAPKVFGGAEAPSPVMGLGVADPSRAVRLGTPRLTRLGDDVLLECDVLPSPAQGGPAGEAPAAPSSEEVR